MNSGPLLLGILAAGAVSAVLSALQGAATEFGLRRLQHRARSGNGADGPMGWIPDPEKMLVILQVGNQLAKIVAVVLWIEWLERLSVPWPGRFTVTLAVMGLFLVLAADAVPRTLGRARPEETLRYFGRPLRYVFAPLIPLAGLLIRLRDLLRGRPPDPEEAAERAEEEIRSIVEATDASRQLPTEEGRMIRGVIDFTEQVAREVMTPRIDIVAVGDTTKVPELLELIARSGHSRIPVYHETIDDVIGVVVARDLFGPISEGKNLEECALSELIRPALFVPETSPIPVVMADLRRMKTHLAIVVDEYGGTSGVITVEDLVEEIVGEIEDEHDEGSAAPIVRESDSVFLVDARCPVDDAREQIGIDLPDGEDYDTFGGYVFQALGRVPKPGESIDVGPDRVIVESADSRRIRRLRVLRGAAAESGG